MTKIKVMITSYNRLPMLRKVVKAWHEVGAEIHIFDDGSDFVPFTDYPVTWHHFEHGGKKGFWKIWNAMLQELRKPSEHELFVFSADDFLNPKVDEIIARHKHLNKWAYAHNLVNDGRLACWTAFMPRVIDPNMIEVGFVDCGFFCNRKALDAVSYYVTEPNEDWQRTHGSSGVGYQLSKRMLKRHVTMLLPQKSLATHGAHESKMHPKERKRNPLISK